MRTRLLITVLAGLLLAGATMLTMPRFGETGGWRRTFSPTLPAPTGPYDVGMRRVRVADPDRADPWRPAERRKLMIDVHYPAGPGRTPLAYYAVAPVMTELGSLDWAPTQERRLGLRAGDVNWMFRTHSHEWVPPARGSFPVLICSAPPGTMRTAYTAISEELASRGFVVVTVDHPYDAPVVELYPTRRVIRPSDATRVVSRAETDAIRVADLRFVVSRLSRLDPDVSGVLDERRLGLFGWVGSDAATSTALANMRGVSAVASVGARPGAADAHHGSPAPAPEPSGGPRAWRMDVTVHGATDRDYTDDGAVLAQVARRYPVAAPPLRRESAAANVGGQDGDTPRALAYRTVRRYLVGFFDGWRRGVPIGLPAPGSGVTVDVRAL